MKWPSLLMALASLGCFSLDLVEPYPNRSTAFQLYTAVSHDSIASTYSVHGSLRRGALDGTLVSLSTDTLYVDNLAMPATAQSGYWEFAKTFSRTPPPATDSIRVSVPLPRLAANRMFAFAIPMAVRLDPIGVTLTPGTDLRLHVSLVAGDSIRFNGGVDQWQLLAKPNCGSSAVPAFILRGTGPYPPEIRIATDLLTALPKPFNMCFSSFGAYALLNTPYPMSAVFSWSTSWVVR